MKKTLLLTVALALMCVGAANAQWTPGTSVGQPDGLNLSWTQCDAAAGIAGLNIVALCTSNTAFSPNNALRGELTSSRVLVASFAYPAGETALDANDFLLDFQTDLPTIPCWWNMLTTNAPRATSLALAFIPPSGGDCGDYWGLAPNGIVGQGFGRNLIAGNSKLRLNGFVAIAGSDGQAMQQPNPGDEVFSFTMAIKPAASVGTCTGCLNKACIVLQQLLLSSNDQGPRFVTNPSTRNYVTWQGGAIGGAGCPAATPTQSKTWGSVKTLYR